MRQFVCVGDSNIEITKNIISKYSIDKRKHVTRMIVNTLNTKSLNNRRCIDCGTKTQTSHDKCLMCSDDIWAVKRNHVRRYNLLRLQNNQCCYCACKLSLKDATIEHITPQSKGGTSEFSNLLASCQDCNVRRGNRDFDGFMKTNLVFALTKKNKSVIPLVVKVKEKK